MDEITFLPQTNTEVSGDDVEVFDKFMHMLNDCDDVQDVYHNAEVVRQALAKANIQHPSPPLSGLFVCSIVPSLFQLMNPSN